MSNRFSVQETPVLGGWQVFDSVTGRVQRFRSDRVGAADYADWQNQRAAAAARHAA